MRKLKFAEGVVTRAQCQSLFQVFTSTLLLAVWEGKTSINSVCIYVCVFRNISLTILTSGLKCCERRDRILLVFVYCYMSVAYVEGNSLSGCFFLIV